MYNILHTVATAAHKGRTAERGKNEKRKEIKKVTVTSISIIKSDVFMCKIDDFDSTQNLHTLYLCAVHHLFLPLLYPLRSFHFDSRWFFTVADNFISLVLLSTCKRKKWVNVYEPRWLFRKSTPDNGFRFFVTVIFFCQKRITIAKNLELLRWKWMYFFGEAVRFELKIISWFIITFFPLLAADNLPLRQKDSFKDTNLILEIQKLHVWKCQRKSNGNGILLQETKWDMCN